MEFIMFRSATALLTIGILMTAGCSMMPGAKKKEQIAEIETHVRQINEKLPPMKPMVLRVVGYGAIDPKAISLSEVQRRLMAMRASKLDAYRTLAERVYGTQIIGNTTVENLVAKNDRFRTYVDSYVLGAKVISQDELHDGSFETVLEMVIDEGFRNCLTSENQMRQNAACASEVVHDLSSFEFNALSRQGLNSSDGGLYFIE
jgi:hypothetical protein